MNTKNMHDYWVKLAKAQTKTRKARARFEKLDNVLAVDDVRLIAAREALRKAEADEVKALEIAAKAGGAA